MSIETGTYLYCSWSKSGVHFWITLLTLPLCCALVRRAEWFLSRTGFPLGETNSTGAPQKCVQGAPALPGGLQDQPGDRHRQPWEASGGWCWCYADVWSLQPLFHPTHLHRATCLSGYRHVLFPETCLLILLHVHCLWEGQGSPWGFPGKVPTGLFLQPVLTRTLRED